jgi:hypothetical protein
MNPIICLISSKKVLGIRNENPNIAKFQLQFSPVLMLCFENMLVTLLIKGKAGHKNTFSEKVIMVVTRYG